MLKKNFFLILMAVLVILSGLTVSVLAQTFPPSEDNPPKESAPINEVYGDDPDETGYTGEDNRAAEPITASESGIEQAVLDIDLSNEPDALGYEGEPLIFDAPITPSESEDALPNLSFPSLDGEPDHSPENGTSATQVDEGPRWSGFYYYNVAGSTFHPRASSSTWAYGGSGCIYRTAGSQPFVLFLNLPEGSKIDYLRVFFYDTDAINGFAGITRYDGGGSVEDLVSVYSTGSSGYDTRLSSYLGHIVDNAGWAYTVYWNPNTNSGTMQICSLRVAYRLP
jgi:hypothetical protein